MSNLCKMVESVIFLKGILRNVSTSWRFPVTPYYSDVIMSAMASQITGASIVPSTVCSSADQRKHQNSVSLAFVRGIHRWPVVSPNKRPVTLKMFPIGWLDWICLTTTHVLQDILAVLIDSNWWCHHEIWKVYLTLNQGTRSLNIIHNFDLQTMSGQCQHWCLHQCNSISLLL